MINHFLILSFEEEDFLISKVSYAPLWKTLSDKEIKKEELTNIAKISKTTFEKLINDEVVSKQILEKIAKALDVKVEKIAIITEYNYPLDVAQKITFFILLLIAIFSPGFKMIIVMAGSIFGRVILISSIQLLLEDSSTKKKIEKPFLNINEGIWSLIVLVSLLIIMIWSIVQEIILEQFEFINIILYILFIFIAHSIFTKETEVTFNPEQTDPNEVGTYMWQKENGVRRVSSGLYRDKNGNYYNRSAAGFTPTSTPVSINKKK